MDLGTDSLAQNIRRAAMNLLARREHGFNELVTKLGLRFPKEQIVQQIERLRDEGLQNDHRFVESFINSRRYRYGPVRIRMDLLQRRIDSELIDEYLFQDDESWYELACELKERKFGPDTPADYKQRSKQLRYLVQKGFALSQASRCFS